MEMGSRVGLAKPSETQAARSAMESIPMATWSRGERDSAGETAQSTYDSRLAKPHVNWSFATTPIFASRDALRIQPKLQVGAVDDPLEREADNAADQVPEWIVEDPGRRAKGLEQVRRDMEVVAQIGGRRIAMPPAGVLHENGIALSRISERYRAVLELGDQAGVVPELEFWGTSPYLNRLSQTAYVALEASHSKACVLADVFHLYKGGSGFEGLRLLSGQAIQVIHLNDYPVKPPRASISDRDRVYPGDGVAPLNEILSDLQRVAPGVVLSLELFNSAYWKGDPLDTARTGLAKMKAAVRAAARLPTPPS
jgi:sugar phosphate isomerase/epimerase